MARYIPQTRIHLKELMRFSSTFRSQKQLDVDVSKIRNIGIMAHIDAGKTTTTERMLYYSGMINTVGEVHRGDTVMDYMEQERNRGITITSASITFAWKNHRINLIDTPGHVDFTVEVERTLRVLDGAVTIIDASAGVQAQTITVWRQADRYKVPRIIFLNKMDKIGANVNMSLKSIEEKLKAHSLLLHIPLGEEKKYHGFVQLSNMHTVMWDPASSCLGKNFVSKPLTEEIDPELWNCAMKARSELVEKLADVDDELAEAVLQRESTVDISALELESALRRVTLAKSGVPVLCGSAYKNMGVQPLLDAVLKYLPAPHDFQHEFTDCYQGQLCALVFKVVFHKQMGPLTFLRIFSGKLESGQKVHNVSQQKGEKLGKLMVAFADEFQEVTEVTAGNIAVVTGLKDTITGDTITSSASVANAAQKVLSKKNAAGITRPVLAGIQIPEPVFFCSVEPSSLAYQKPLEDALSQLQREDPSLRVKTDPDTGQTVLMGMGQLHLSIIQERIRKEFRVEVDLGALQVAYKETLKTPGEASRVLDRRVGDTHHWVKLILGAVQNPGGPSVPEVTLFHTKENMENLALVRPAHLKAIQHGVESALNAGPLLSHPVIDVSAQLKWLEVKPRTSDAMISAAAARCFREALASGGTQLLEPKMHLEVEVGDVHLGGILADLSQRRAQVEHVGHRNGTKVVHALVPLAELRDYSTDLRTITSGMATFSLEFHSYDVIPAQEQVKLTREVMGFAFT